MIENRQLLDIWLEKLTTQTIKLSENNAGQLIVDSKGNFLRDGISGGRKITKALGSFGNGVLFYTSKSWCIIKEDFDIENKVGLQNYYNTLIIPDDETINYKIEGRIQNINSFDGNSVLLASPYNSATYTIFKVILNGKEVTDYFTDSTMIGFNSGYNTFGNTLTVIYYRDSQTITSQSFSLYFKGVYKSVPTYDYFSKGVQLAGTVNDDASNIFKLNGSTSFTSKLSEGDIVNVLGVNYTVASILSSTVILVDRNVPDIPASPIYYFPAYNLLSVDTDFALTPSSSYYQRNILGSKIGIKKLLSTSNTIQLTKWIDANDDNYSYCNYPVMNNKIANYLNKGDTFRLVILNKVTNEMTILNNARMSEKSTLNINADKTTQTLNVEFESKITLSNYSETFGDANKTYGEGLFGGLSIRKGDI